VILAGENRNTLSKICPSVTWITTSPTSTSLTLNPGLCNETPVTDCLATVQPELLYRLITGWTKECKTSSIRIYTIRAEIRTLGPPEYEVRMYCAICGSSVFTVKRIKMFVNVGQARSVLCYTICCEVSSYVASLLWPVLLSEVACNGNEQEQKRWIKQETLK